MTAAQKTPYALSLNRFAEKKVFDAIQLLGKALPCSVTAVSGSIVTVKFELNVGFTLPSITVPMMGPEYIRYPLQVGCLGVVFPADVRLGGVSGLGGGTGDLSLPANLSALVFIPISNKNWSQTDDPNKTLIYGPDGVIIRNVSKTVKVTISDTGATIDLQGGLPLTINGLTVMNGPLQLNGPIENVGGGTYLGDFKTAGDVVSGFGTGDQVSQQNHTHQYDRPTGVSAPAQTVKPTPE